MAAIEVMTIKKAIAFFEYRMSGKISAPLASVPRGEGSPDPRTLDVSRLAAELLRDSATLNDVNCNG